MEIFETLLTFTHLGHLVRLFQTCSSNPSKKDWKTPKTSRTENDSSYIIPASLAIIRGREDLL